MPTTFLVPKNNAASTLSADITSGATTIPVVDASQFPSTYPFHISIENEIIEVGNKSGNNLTSCIRAREGTAAASHISATAVDLFITAQAVSDLNAAVNVVEDVVHDSLVELGGIGTTTPGVNDLRLFGRLSGNNIQLIMRSATGQECLICTLVNVAHTNTLALNWIQ